MAARRLFGSFRKGDANDPETYVAAVLTVLMDYSDAVVNEVCHPGRGLPSRCDFLPTMKEIKDACEAEATRVQRLEKYAALPRTDFKRLPSPARQPVPTIFTAQDFPHYERLKKRFEDGDGPAHFANHFCIDKIERYGIWTPYHWVAESGVMPKRKIPLPEQQPAQEAADIPQNDSGELAWSQPITSETFETAK